MVNSFNMKSNLNAQNGLRSGLISLLVFYCADALGILFNQRYDLFNQAVSELVAVSAPNKSLLIMLFTSFFFLILLFSFSLTRLTEARQTMLGTRIFALTCITGIIMLTNYPVEPPGKPLSVNEIYHTLLATIVFIGALLAIWFIGTDRQGLAPSPVLARYSRITVALMCVAELIMVWSVFNKEYLFGIIERIAIFLFLQWIYIFSIVVYKKSHQYRSVFYIRSAFRLSIVTVIYYTMITAMATYGAFTSF